ncbi:single-stranded DNA-binding protein [Vibrio pectenicida]|uniref:Single-stranded DNA-binding protein n=1 Tax=Vibrio pectenicida TaxID=62763 RepID=A0A427TVX2_9VIBR|nr:single-stranded DNA-binding protein [Vibrio pectenicida]RSD28571.1 single-stranded DNA-binding protein [Vibrio pectenicida]
MARGIFIFDGNVGQVPELRWQPANERSEGQPRPLLKLTVKYDRLVKSNHPDRLYDDKGGFWVNVDYWKNNADDVAKLLKKGMRIRVEGELRIDTWEDKNNPGQMQSGMALTAETITIVPSRIESIGMKSSQVVTNQAPPIDHYSDEMMND